MRVQKNIFFLILLSFFSLCSAQVSLQLNPELVNQVLTAPVKQWWPHAVTFFATQTATYAIPCRIFGAKGDALLAGGLGILSSLCTLSLLKAAEHKSLSYKIAAVATMPALCSVCICFTAQKRYGPPLAFLLTSIPLCAALAAVHYGCA